MGPDRIAWTDSRLDDRFRGIEETRNAAIKRLDARIDDAFDEIRVNRDLPRAVAEMAVQLKYIGNGIRDCLEAQEKLDERFEKYVKEQDTLRRATFRWVFGSVLAATGLVLTAVGLLVGKF
jgi:CHASE3 domain sensor protein